MRILHIIPNLLKGGAERLVIDVCNELRLHPGCEVKLVIFEDKNKYRELSCKVDIEIVNVSLELSIWKKNKVNVASLQDFIEGFEPDVIHSHLFFAELVSRACFYPKTKWFTHGHDNMVQFSNFGLNTLLHKSTLVNFYEKEWLFKRYVKNGGTSIISIANDSLNYFTKTASKFNNLMLHNGIKYDTFYKKRDHEENETLRLINVGSLVDKKNQKFLLDVAFQLKINGIKFTLNMFGDGRNREKLELKISKYDLTSSVKLNGNVSNIENHFQNADIYVHTATYEPLGLVLIEAMAAGLPVICLDGKGNKDLIKQGENGFIVEEDAHDFSSTVAKLFEDKVELKRISQYAQKFAKNFDIKNYVNNLVVEYNKRTHPRGS